MDWIKHFFIVLGAVTMLLLWGASVILLGHAYPVFGLIYMAVSVAAIAATLSTVVK